MKIKIFSLIFITCFFITACGEYKESPNFQLCRDKGGIPIASLWDDRILKNCIFPGCKCTSNQITGADHQSYAVHVK